MASVSVRPRNAGLKEETLPPARSGSTLAVLRTPRIVKEVRASSGWIVGAVIPALLKCWDNLITIGIFVASIRCQSISAYPWCNIDMDLVGTIIPPAL